MSTTVPSTIVPAYLTPKDAAAYLSVTPKTIHNMAADGRLKMVRFSPRIVRITRESIEALAAKGSK